MDWQPIETAPRDGTYIFVWAPGFMWPEVVQYLPYDPETAEDAGEPGYWTYAEDILANATDSPEADTWSHWAEILSPTAAPGQQASHDQSGVTTQPSAFEAGSLGVGDEG